MVLFKGSVISIDTTLESVLQGQSGVIYSISEGNVGYQVLPQVKSIQFCRLAAALMALNSGPPVQHH